MTSITDAPPRGRWRTMFRRASKDQEYLEEKPGPAKWSMGILNDSRTVEVPGTV